MKGQDWICTCGASGYEAAGAPELERCPTCGKKLDPRPEVKARLGAGLQADGRPRGHGGGCRCHECRMGR
jgi:hypothetical protein